MTYLFHVSWLIRTLDNINVAYCMYQCITSLVSPIYLLFKYHFSLYFNCKPKKKCIHALSTSYDTLCVNYSFSILYAFNNAL